MNLSQVCRQLGILVLLLAAFMLSSSVWAILDWHEAGAGKVLVGVLASVGLSSLVGVLLWYPHRRDKATLFRREAVAVVGLGWILAGVLGALPYWLSGVMTGEFSGWFNIGCAGFFESVSGFSCTGSTVFSSPEDLPRAILFWRSLTQWLGGMGIVVLFVAVLGRTGPAAKFLFSAEVPGPVSESIHPRIRGASLLLWQIYLGLSAALTIMLCLEGMTVFESLCHTFATMASGGFSTRNASVGSFGSLSIEITLIVFMILATVNFNLFALLLQGRWRPVVKSREVWAYLGILAVAILLIMTDIRLSRPVLYDGCCQTVRGVVFNVVSIMSTTGYGVGDFNLWPTFSRWLMVMLMFVGGCAGSTSGAIKVVRVVLFVRIVKLEVERMFRPYVVRPLNLGSQAIDDNVRRSISSYIALHIGIALLSVVVLLMLHNDFTVPESDQLDIESAFTSVVATLNNIGPGLNMVGATSNFGFLTGPAKLLLSLLMIIGRLEILVVLSLFMPSFWRRR